MAPPLSSRPTTRHAEVENAIRDIKYGDGLNHIPSGRFGANTAWLGLNMMAHNLARFTSRIGLGEAWWPPTPCAGVTCERRASSASRLAASRRTFWPAGRGPSGSTLAWPTCGPW